MPPKKRKQTDGGTKSEAAAAKKPAAAESPSSSLATLLNQIQLISRNKARCTELLQAFYDGKDDHTDCSWILVATHVIQRMVQHVEKNKEASIVLAALCHALAVALYADRGKLERTAHNAGTEVGRAVRSALARAIMSVTIGSTCALQHLVKEEEMEPSLIRKAMWSALMSLDIVVNHSLVKVTATGDGWNQALQSLLTDAGNLDMEHEDELAAACAAASKALSKEENACIAALLEKDAPSSSTGKRRRASSRKDDSPSLLATQFPAILDMQSLIVIDGRVSIRRWASMTFTWFCQGQQLILEVVNALLSHEEYWTSVLDCPAVIGPKDPPEEPVKRSPRKGKKSAEPPKESPPIHTPGNVATVALACRLLDILSESGNSSGARAPTGGMDTYAALVLGLTDTGKGRGRSGGTESLPTWKKADVRDLASVVIYKLIQAHSSCLQTNCISDKVSGWVLVNDETEGFAAAVPNGVLRPLEARFYPTVHKTVSSVCQTAAVSEENTGYGGGSLKRLLGIASAFVLGSSVQGAYIMDAKLYNFAVRQLADCVLGLASDEEQTSTTGGMPMDTDDADVEEDKEDWNGRVAEEHRLNEPLPIPTMSPAPTEKATRKKKKTKKSAELAQNSSHCTFGGIFPQASTNDQHELPSMSNEELLSLLIRSVNWNGLNPSPAGLLTELIEIVRSCYDLHEPPFESPGIAEESAHEASKRVGKKRVVSPKASQGKRKRKKTSDGGSETVVTEGSSSYMDRASPKSMKSIRAGLATDSLNALRMLLLPARVGAPANSARRELRRYIRETLTTEHVCSIVDLSRMLGEALIDSHVAHKKALDENATSGGTSTFFTASHPGGYRHFERMLWSSHIQLCQMIGRGQASFDLRKSIATTKPILGDAPRRLSIFQAVAASSKRKTHLTAASSSPPDLWPLCLPAAQLALITSNLTSEPLPSEDNSSPELYIAQTLMSSIADALRNPSTLTHAEWYASSPDCKEEEAIVDEDDVPLALRDARLLVVTVSRLPKKMQMKFLKEFVATLSSAMDALRSNESHVALLRENAEVSGFLARVVTVCATLVNVVTIIGPRLRDALFLQIGPAQYATPNLVPKKDTMPQRLQEYGDWYRCETSFVGIFSDWESPVIPDVAGSGPIRLEKIDRDTVSNLSSFHESAIHLGFSSAKRDRCYLLFAAWDASGRSVTWDEKSVESSLSQAIGERSSPRLLIEIRDEICSLYREIHGSQGSFPESILTNILEHRSDGKRKAGHLKVRLESMMSKAETMINSITCALASQGEPTELSLVSFALLEALAGYVAFVVSAHTRSIDTYLSPLPSSERMYFQGHRTGPSRGSAGSGEGLGPILSDEGSTVSDAEAQEDDRIHTFMQLSEACVTFGAAPTHPDWLDVSCSLRDGITADDAVQMADRALKCLENLSSIAQTEYVKWLFHALLSLCGNDDSSKRRAALALRLFLIGAGGAGEESDPNEHITQESKDKWAEAIASFCGLEACYVMDLVSRDVFCKNESHASETFCRNSAQRILGKLHEESHLVDDWIPSLAEYRARDEWELVLSDALLGCCMDYELSESSAAEGGPASDKAASEWKRGYTISGRWARLHDVCDSHQMPAAALLRFGLCGGQGRKRHPLANPGSKAEDDDDAVAIPLEFSEPLPLSVNQSQHGQDDDLLRTLATLARSSADFFQDGPPKVTSRAVASNLMVDSKSFLELEATEALGFTFTALHQIRDLLHDDKNDVRASSSRYLSERLICLVEKLGMSSPSSNTSLAPASLLLSFLGGSFRLSVDTIKRQNVGHIAIFSSSTRENFGGIPPGDKWTWQQKQDQAIVDMVGMLIGDDSDVSVESRSRASHILRNLVEQEHSYENAGTPEVESKGTGLFPSVIKALNGIDDSQHRILVKWIICSPSTDACQFDVLEKISANLCRFVSFVVGAAGSGDEALCFPGGRIILDALLDTLDQWLSLTSGARYPVMALLCLLGARYGALHTIGALLVSKITAASDDSLGPIETFFQFVQDVDKVLSGKPSENAPSQVFGGSKALPTSASVAATNACRDSANSSEKRQSQDVTDADKLAPRACSFVLRSGFHAQHWYNCYTCGLVWDKGCCSLCALVCHRDHDVAYSRNSSFFCDCGGEAASSDDEIRVPCKCLSPVDAEEAEKLFDEEKWAVINGPRKEDSETCSRSDVPCVHSEEADAYTFAVHLASSALKNYSKASVEKLRTEASCGDWSSQLFQLLRSKGQQWSRKEKDQVGTDAVIRSEGSSTDLPAEILSSDQSYGQSLRDRSGKVLDLQRLGRPALLPVRAARASSFQLGMSNDSTTDRVKRAMLAKNGIKRRAVVADCRGRVIVAEPCSLLFCSLLPSVNVRYEDNSVEVPCTRGQMNIIGTSSVKFHIVGMELCRSNERHLAVWGTSEACIVILSEAFDKVEKTIDLAFELEPDECEVDYLVKASWIPGSQSILAVACGPFVKLFDIRVTEDGKANPLASYSLAYEAVLRDIALVPEPFAESASGTLKTAERTSRVPETVKLMLLLDIGQIQAIDLNFDEKGELQEQGDMYIESGEGIMLPITGVRIGHSNQVAAAGARTRSMGEGSSLVFLPQSGVLLYTCVSACVVALLLDASGEISGSFELLPNVVKSEVLGTGSEGYNINGPYLHWTELGFVEDEGSQFFRLLCTGKSSRTNQPKILCVDYNKDIVRVKEVAWSAGSSMGMGLSMSSAFDGLAAFSAPALAIDGRADGPLKCSDFKERAYVCAVVSNGSMLIFGEEMNAAGSAGPTDGEASTLARTRSPVVTVSRSTSQPSFPLTVFEKLVNVSDVDGLTFGGDRIGSDSVGTKEKLSSKNGTYFVCPSRDGCTITISLRKTYDDTVITRPAIESHETLDLRSTEQAFPAVSEMMQNELVIVAVRLLVGSTLTESIPKYVSVEGRRVALKADLKKWYDLPLTGEEIALGLRNGFISLGIGPSFDTGNNPLLDAIEVYATTRAKISHWLPLTSHMKQHVVSSHPANVPADSSVASTQKNELTLSVLTLTHLLRVLGPESHAPPEAHEAVRQLIQTTALDGCGETRRSITGLLSQIEPDSCMRQMILDEGTLVGVSEALRAAKTSLCESHENHLHSSDELWDQASRAMRDSLKASAAITRTRPGNYKAALEKMLVKGRLADSIAMDAYQMFRIAKREGLNCHGLIPDFVELVLAESLLFPSQSSTGGPRATFDILAELLRSRDEDLVNLCCESISSYWTQKLSGRNRDAVSQSRSAPSVPISYQCDSCSLFPIKGSRYTFPEGSTPSSGGDNDIDLCSACFRDGRDFAASNHYDPNVDVKIGGHTVGKNSKLSCASLGRMEPVAIQTSLLVSRSQEVSTVATETLQQTPLLPSEGFAEYSGIDLGEFASSLFSHLLQLLVDQLKSGQLDCPSASGSLMNLLLDMIRNSGNDMLEMSRAKQFAEAVSSCAPVLIGMIEQKEEMARSVMIVCLRGLTRLVASKDDASGRLALSNMDDCSVEDTLPELLPVKAKGKTDPRFICDVHGVAAVRRRCSQGDHKNRRFYVCGMARSSRCKYFKWADTEDSERETVPQAETKCKFTAEIESFVWKLFKKPYSADSRPLHALLCQILELDVHDSSTGALSLPADVGGISNEEDGANKSGSNQNDLSSSMYDQRTAASDYVDGVFCSMEKLRVKPPQWLLEGYSSAADDRGMTHQGEDSVIRATLDLLSRMAGTAASEGETECDGQGQSEWFSLLCEIISSSKSPRYRALAKGVLKRLCGDDRELYHSVRDHYVFGFQFRVLLREAQGPLLEALNVRERARQCGVNWRSGGKISFDNLPAGGLIGTDDLASEDCLTVARSKKIRATLDELADVAKNRCSNWRNFCGLPALPRSHRGDRATHKNDSTTEGRVGDVVDDPNLLGTPPIVSLVWIACALSGEIQVKVMKLIDVAMNTSDCAQPHPKLLSVAGDTLLSKNEDIDSPTSDGRTDADVKEGGDSEGNVPGSASIRSLPETALLKGEKAMLVDEVYAFTVQFVVRGSDPQLRKVGGKIAFKLCQRLQTADFEWIFVQLVNRALGEQVELGATCYELFRLLQSLAACGIAKSSGELVAASRKVVHAFTAQMRSLHHEVSGLGGESLTCQKDEQAAYGESDMSRFDFTSCVHCHREPVATDPQGPSSSSERQSVTESRGSSRTSRQMPRGINAGASTTSPAAVAGGSSLLPEQVRPFARERLEASIDASVSTEFATYIQLKCRLAVSDIHLSVSDPRGRFVKTIAVYFTPRQVTDVNRLKSEEYSHVWQRCATLSLSRGAVRVSGSLSEPIIAANLRIEYLEFYERPGGSRSADGSLLLHCPRCTRVVNNAHGVCGHCGEVAFQCRKCRHINYDRLDAFLCVECGYCSAGTFSYELTAGAASNAVAIVDDDSYNRTIKILRVATKLHEDLRNALNERLRPAITGKRSLSVQKYGPALKRTFLGELPKISRDKVDSLDGSSGRRSRGSTSGSTGSARQRGDSNALGSNRARSLLRLARQLRNDTSSDRSRGDFLLRQALLSTGARGISIDEIDEMDSDVLGIMHSSDLDASDPLSRLVASIQGRARAGRDLGGDASSSSRPNDSENAQSGTGGENTALSAKATSEECNRLYQLMREAERECFELQRRINAWKRLENDALADLGTDDEATYAFSPSQCSKCRGPIALQLLVLAMELVGSDAKMQTTITPDFVRALFDEPANMDKDLFEVKRLAIATLATKSEYASKLVLNELRARLRATMDVASSEILGKIIASESPLSDEFVKLATETLESGY